MTESIFKVGIPQTITDILDVKDRRQAYQQKLLAEYPNQLVVAIKLNIPGPIKNNAQIAELFTTGANRYMKHLVDKKFNVIFQKEWHLNTGEELFLVVDSQSYQTLKTVSICFEDVYELGRLFDVDILSKRAQAAFSRKDMGLAPRKCLICDQDAKACARSRTHSVEEMQNKISQMYEEDHG